MGALTLPTVGPVYLDADAIIYSVEKIEPYASLLRPLWLAAQVGRFLVISSELTLLETLVKALQTHDPVLESSFRTLLLASREIQLVPLSRTILETAARLRATAGVKTPDALHAATALEARCALFVTNDAGYRRVPGLPLTILHDVLTTPTAP